MSSYPPPAKLRTELRQPGHRSSTSSSSQAHTLVNHGDDTRNLSVPPSAYAGDGRRSNHKAKRSSFSVTSTVVEAEQNGHQQPFPPPAQRSRSKSSSSSNKISPTTPTTPQPPQSHPDASLSIPPSHRRRRRRRTEPTCCGVVQESAARAREKRYGGKPTPWIVLKLMVGVTFGIMVYCAYVYVGLLVAPMLQQKRGAEGSRKTGIGLLVGFGILWLWTVWAYCKVVFTAPGYARDYVPKTQKPSSTVPPPLLSFAPQLPPMQSASHIGLGLHDPERGGFSPSHSIGGPSYEDMLAVPSPAPVTRAMSNATVASLPASLRHNFNSADSGSESEEEADERNRPTRVALDDAMGHRLRRKSGWMQCCRRLALSESGSRPRTYIARRPPMTPVLDPLYRYCDKDTLVKPYRTHHCRNCGTCVLKYDHHCPWIGQCVGARNHKFFLNLCQAAFMCTTYTIGTLLPYTIRGFTKPNLDVNPQQIVVVAISALFAMFTLALTVSHTHMIMQGQTTVESMYIASMKTREREQLAKAYRWWECGGKMRKLREWDREWGKLDTEGHIWWNGGPRREWELVMGKNVLGWILPIGRSPGDGLDYPVNQRFDPDSGRWRRREEWPRHLR